MAGSTARLRRLGLLLLVGGGLALLVVPPPGGWISSDRSREMGARSDAPPVGPGVGPFAASGPRTTVSGPPTGAVGPPPPDVPAWGTLPDGTTPWNERSGQAVAFDPAEGATVAFGGYDGRGTSRHLFGDTWEFNGSWRSITSTPSPPPRTYGAMTWDPVDRGLILFGGTDPVANAYFNDTWMFADGRWTQLASVASPPELLGPGLTWDPAISAVVLFGGYSPTSAPSGTWTFASGNWTRLSTTLAPPPGVAESLTYDPTIPAVVLWGDQVVDGATGVWTFGGHSWARTNETNGPPARNLAAFQFDAQLGGDLLVGGTNDPAWNVIMDDTWILRNGAWLNLTSSAQTHPKLVAATLASGPGMGGLLLVGGDTGSFTTGYNATYEFYTINVSLSIVPAAGYAPLNVTLNASEVGGSAPFSFAWSLGDGRSASGAQVQATYRDPGVYLPYATVTDVNGASTSASGRIQAIAPMNVSAVVSPVTGVAPLTVVGSAASVGGLLPVNFSWTFALGAVRYATGAQYTYTYPGVFVVTLGATDAGADYYARSWTIIVSAPTGAALSLAVSESAAVGSPPFSVSFQSELSGGTGPYAFYWTFGDGTSSRESSPTHTYTNVGGFDVRVTVLDALAESASWFGSVSSVAPLIVAAGGSVTSGAAPLAVTFAGTAAGGSPAYTYLWTFGDGGAAALPQTDHTYIVPGAYAATFYAWDSNGSLKTAVVNITVTPAPGHAPTTNVTREGAAMPLDWTWLIAIGLGFIGGVAWAVIVPLPRRRPPLRPPRGAEADRAQ